MYNKKLLKLVTSKTNEQTKERAENFKFVDQKNCENSESRKEKTFEKILKAEDKNKRQEEDKL